MSMNKEEQFYSLTCRCYDDLCFYDRMDMTSRKNFVDTQVAGIKDKNLIIPYLPLYITTKCSLNCEKCNNLIPDLKCKGVDFSWDKTKASLERILDCIDEMIFCELVGGEPFLAPEFEQILDFVASQSKIRRFVVVTNATVSPPQSVIRKLADYKALVRVSDYGLFEKMSSFIVAMDNEGVNVRVQQNMKWNDPGGIEKRGKKSDELKRQYNRCEFSMKCKYLCEDRLFTCARAASLYHMGLIDGGLDALIIDESISSAAIRNFYLRDCGDACDYCDLWSDTAGMEIPAAIQIGGKKLRHSSYTVISNYELDHFKKSTKKYEKLLKEKQDI